MRIRSILGSVSRVAMSVLVAGAIGLPPMTTSAAPVKAAPHTAVHGPGSTGVHAAVHPAKNPHVHVPSSVSKSTKKPTAQKGVAAKASKQSVSHARTAQRVYVHHNGGMISGVVHGASGQKLVGVSVHLKPNIHREFKSHAARHYVHTNSAGVFRMRGVKASNYRVVASKKNSGSGHAEIHLLKGGHPHVTIALAGAKKRK